MTIRRYLAIALLMTLATSITAAGAAHAASGAQAVIADCNKHLRLTHSYTAAELEKALRILPADVAEYSNCKDVIERGLLGLEGKTHVSGAGSASSSGSALPTALIVVLVALALAAVTLGAVAIRRRRG